MFMNLKKKAMPLISIEPTDISFFIDGEQTEDLYILLLSFVIMLIYIG